MATRASSNGRTPRTRQGLAGRASATVASTLPPPPIETRPSQRAVQGEKTRQALLRTATRMFGRYGYEQTGLDDVVRAAHVTKGALYHHFENKQELFRAVYQGVEAKLRADMAWEERTVAPGPGGWTRFSDALCTFLRLAAEPQIHQIRCVDGPAMLTWRGSLNVEGMGLQTFRDAITEGIEFGDIRPLPVDATAFMLRAAMTEGSSYVVHAPNFEAALKEATASLRAILDGLRVGPGVGRTRSPGAAPSSH